MDDISPEMKEATVSLTKKITQLIIDYSKENKISWLGVQIALQACSETFQKLDELIETKKGGSP